MARWLFLFGLLCAGFAHAAEVAGVRFEDKATLGSAETLLNGAGQRAKLFLKVYAIGLYLPEKKTAAADVLALAGAKRLQIVTLRELTAEQFADALVEGIHKNHSEVERQALRPQTDQLRAAILALKTAPKGAVIMLDWLPETGTRLIFNGEKKGADIPGEAFYRALLKIWLGEHPAAGDLRDALLGKS